MFTSGYLAKISYIACFIYIASTAIRLARFNSRNQTTDKKYFMGLASPAAAAILICYVWLMQDLGVVIQSYVTLTVILTVSLSILMVSNIAYMSFKDINFRQKIPYIMLFVISLAISFISFDPPKVLFIFFLFYGLSGPGLYFFRRFKRSKLNPNDISAKDNQ